MQTGKQEGEEGGAPPLQLVPMRRQPFTLTASHHQTTLFKIRLDSLILMGKGGNCDVYPKIDDENSGIDIGLEIFSKYFIETR